MNKALQTEKDLKQGFAVDPLDQNALYQSPPDIEKCFNHLKACQPYIPPLDDNAIDICPCCNRKFVRVDRIPNPRPIPICINYDYIEFTDQVGHAPILYFIQMRYYFYLFLALFPLALTTSILNITDQGSSADKNFVAEEPISGIHLWSYKCSLANCKN